MKKLNELFRSRTFKVVRWWVLWILFWILDLILIAFSRDWKFWGWGLGVVIVIFGQIPLLDKKVKGRTAVILFIVWFLLGFAANLGLLLTAGVKMVTEMEVSPVILLVLGLGFFASFDFLFRRRPETDDVISTPSDQV